MAYGMIDSVLGANIEKQTEDLRILKPYMHRKIHLNLS